MVKSSYSLNAQLTRRRARLTASYTDGVTSARTDTLNRGGSPTGTLDSPISYLGTRYCKNVQTLISAYRGVARSLVSICSIIPANR